MMQSYDTALGTDRHFIDMYFYRMILFGGIAVSAFAQADGYGQSVFIPGWHIETSESEVSHDRKSSYPAWNLIDGNARTTWVYSASDYPKPLKNETRLAGKYFVSFRPDNPVMLDELRLMTGYNKSDSLYYKNSRPIEIAVFEGYPYDWTGGKPVLGSNPVRLLTLNDKPGEKSIRLPKRKYESLYVVFTKVKAGEVDDLCVSEITPRIAGINALPDVTSFLYSPGTGDSCGCGAAFVLHTLAGATRFVANYEHPRFEFSPDGRYAAGIHQREKRTSVWVVNLKTGQKIWSKTLPKDTQPEEFKWIRHGLKVPYHRSYTETRNDNRTIGNLVWKAK